MYKVRKNHQRLCQSYAPLNTLWACLFPQFQVDDDDGEVFFTLAVSSQRMGDLCCDAGHDPTSYCYLMHLWLHCKPAYWTTSPTRWEWNPVTTTLYQHHCHPPPPPGTFTTTITITAMLTTKDDNKQLWRWHQHQHHHHYQFHQHSSRQICQNWLIYLWQ